jgi:carboxyl-terminal processing protease
LIRSIRIFEQNMDEQLQPQSVQKKSRSKFLLIGFIILLVAGSFRFGYIQGQSGAAFDAKSFKVINKTNGETTVDYNLLWDAIKVLNSKYIDKPIDEQKLLYGAVKGAAQATGDPYTEFFTPEDLESFKTDLKGSFDGIGAEIGKRNGNIVVVAPLEGSPAKNAGLRAKDVILKVNGEVVTDWSVEQAVKKIRGSKGTEVTLTIFRDGFTEAQDVKIVRDTIEVKSVEWEFKEVAAGDGAKKKIAVITLSRFGDDTESLFAKAAREIQAQSVHGVVLDLRNNPGGYLDTSVNIASYWVPKDKPVVTEEHSSGQNEVFNSQGIGVFENVKTITLINGGSASASEILAGALRDHNLTSLLGEKSFGKGSVQEVVDLQNGAALKVTVAKWITPGGKNLNKDGLNPDIEVKLSDDDIEKEKDPQLERALQEMLQ